MATRKVIKKKIKLGGESFIDWQAVKEMLSSHGVDLDACCDDEDDDEEGTRKIKVVCIADDLKASVDEMGKSQRDQVVMVRVDEETSRSLDAWVESGAVKSRSEAAALFIREGLKLRRSELAQLQDALEDVEQAKERLRKRAREVFGESIDPEAPKE
jgi:Arc/MetJ-type ribon-helix-helix transcriptional regulator